MLLGSEALRYALRCSDLQSMALSVIKGKTVAAEVLVTRYRKACSGVKTAAQQADSAFPVQVSV
jgi:hypothetical protein